MKKLSLYGHIRNQNKIFNTMQGQEKYQKKNNSVLLTSFLFITVGLITYALLTRAISLWPYGLLAWSLWISLLVILLCRSVPQFLTPSFKISLLIFFWVSFATFIGHLAFMDKPEIIQLLTDIQDHFGLKSLLICALLYLILLSLPFVPGIEIGLLIMAAFGKYGVISVYFATVGGLSLAYYFGYSFPHLWEKIGFKRFENLTLFPTKKGVNPETVSQDITFSNTQASPGPALNFLTAAAPWVFRYRYLSLALLINLPGNAILGGGGGISFISGASGKFKWFWFVGTLILATLPVPLLVYFGFMELSLIHI